MEGLACTQGNQDLGNIVTIQSKQRCTERIMAPAGRVSRGGGRRLERIRPFSRRRWLTWRCVSPTYQRANVHKQQRNIQRWKPWHTHTYPTTKQFVLNFDLHIRVSPWPLSKTLINISCCQNESKLKICHLNLFTEFKGKMFKVCHDLFFAQTWKNDILLKQCFPFSMTTTIYKFLIHWLNSAKHKQHKDCILHTADGV